MSQIPRTIFKYRLQPVHEQSITVPVDSIIRHLGVQHGEICLWVEQYFPNGEVMLDVRDIITVGTGEIFFNKNPSDLSYLGTVQLYGSDLILHVYERLKAYQA